MSRRAIPSRERLIFALDVSSLEEARQLVTGLGESISFYKLGLTLFAAGGYFDLVKELVHERGKKVMVDLKFFDVPETVGAAIAQVNEHGATFATVHGNGPMLDAAVRSAGDVKILAVTVLTSLDVTDLREMGFQVESVEQLVLARARRAIQAGCHGVIASGLEASELRREHGDKLLIVTPGIRPVNGRIVSEEEDDQKRVLSPVEALRNGADYIVVGRPIYQADNPRRAAEEIQKSIEDVFG